MVMRHPGGAWRATEASNAELVEAARRLPEMARSSIKGETGQWDERIVPEILPHGLAVGLVQRAVEIVDSFGMRHLVGQDLAERRQCRAIVPAVRLPQF